MKIIWIIIVLLIIAGGSWYFMSKTANPETSETAGEETETNEEEAATADMPAVGEDAEEVAADGVSSDSDATQSAVTINVTGHNFSFSQKEIRVKKGQTVTINFESTEGFHDWVVDEFNATTKKVNPGEPTSVTFVADTAGTFEYYCSVGTHRSHGMVGTLVVE